MTFSIALEIVLSCKNWFMCHVYSSCFDYPKKHIFFLELIQTHIFVSQGSIKFEKNAKIQMLKVSIKRPWMDRWTVCVILKNRFILKTNIWWCAPKWRVGRVVSCWKIIHFKRKSRQSAHKWMVGRLASF